MTLYLFASVDFNYNTGGTWKTRKWCIYFSNST